MSITDTIFALATPVGQSAIAIIRISGAKAHELLFHFGVSKVIVKDKPIAKYQRLIGIGGEIIDDVMLVLFPHQHSPTGEKITEIQCHGSQAVIQKILNHLAEIEGMRPAQPGEFSRRSFNNGKIGLMDLEGVSDLIEARTSRQHLQAMNLMTGKLSSKLSLYREKLISLSSRLETAIDFSDEDLPEDVIRDLATTIRHLRNQILQLIEDSKYAEQIREGVKIALIGPVNVGKSTILNALAKREVAIVSSIAGTTRDVLEVQLNLDGIAVKLTDTAGIRQTEDLIETEGIKRAKDVAENSDLVLLVLDVSNPNWQELLNYFKTWHLTRQLVVLNKVDLIDKNELEHSLNSREFSIALKSDWLIISFHKQNGADILIKKLTEILSYINQTTSDIRLARSWHKTACLSASSALGRAMMLNSEEEPELVAEELRLACDALGRLTGQVDVDELLDKIFSNFCIGK